MTAITRLVARIEGHRPMAELDGLNARPHWRKRAERAAMWRDVIGGTLVASGWPRRLPWPRAVCTITVLAAHGSEPDDDNLAGWAKHLRDSVAAYLETTDAPRGPVEWRYRWTRDSADGVVIELEPAPAAGSAGAMGGGA